MKEHSYGICPYIIQNGSFYVLLNKSSHSNPHYHFFKGRIEQGEKPIQCAIREFYEEAGVKIKKKDLEDKFTQVNQHKNITIYLVDYSKYYKSKFKFSSREIYDWNWVNLKYPISMNPNQKKIMESIQLRFKPRMKVVKYILAKTKYIKSKKDWVK